MRIVVVRHGKTNENREGLISGKSNSAQLIEEGVEHAKHLSNHFKKEKFDVIFSSPLDRAFNTAKPIAQVLNIPIKKDKRLIEVDFGDLDHKSIEKNKEKIQKSELDLNLKFPRGESYLEVLQRAKSFTNELLSNNFKEVLIIGSHRINTAILTALLNLNLKEPTNYTKIGQKNVIVYEVDTEKNLCKWFNTLTEEKGKGLIYER